MPVLFFDIDGCLHPTDAPKLDHRRQKILRAPDDGLFVWAAPLETLLAEFPTLDLVCHSTWRKFYDLDELKHELPRAIAARTVAVVPPVADRDRAVQAYIDHHRLIWSEVAILDDDPWGFPIGTPNLVTVPSATGLSLPSAQTALRQVLATVCAPASTLPVEDRSASHRRGNRP